MIMKELTQEIERSYNKYFKNSKCFVNFSKNLYSSISINCFLANNKEELTNGYWENDMFSIRFSIDTERGQFSKDIDINSEVPENLKLEANAKSYVLRPSVSYMAYDRKKLSFRKTIGDSKKIIATLDKFFKKLHEELEKDLQLNLIHDNHKNLLIEKLI